MYVVGLLGTPLARLDDAVHVGPLAHKIGFSRARLHVTAHDVVGDNIDTECGNHLRQFVLDERVGVIGTAGQEDGEAMLATALLQYLHILLVERPDIVVLRLDGSLIGGLALCTPHAVGLQKSTDLLAEQLLVAEIDDR